MCTDNERLLKKAILELINAMHGQQVQKNLARDILYYIRRAQALLGAMKCD